MNETYHTILLPARPQPDTIVGIFLLKNFGREKYPGIENAAVEVSTTLPKGETENSLQEKGILALDLGGQKFDHHQKNTTASQLIAHDLEIEENPILSKLLRYAERDDKHGMGTISQDQLDRAFGLSGLIAALNKSLPENPNQVVNYILPLLKGHYLEEKRRLIDLPNEYAEKLKSGKANEHIVKHRKKNTKVVSLESDNPSMAGWLKSSGGVKADVVIQKNSSGHVNIVTQQIKKIDLRETAALIREAEARIRNYSLPASLQDFQKPGRVPEVPEWYYDRATNSLLNGGVIPKGTSPTAIPLERIVELTKDGLAAQIMFYKPSPSQDQPRERQYFLEIRIPGEKAQEIAETVGIPPAGFKIHRPENYHLTLLYLGRYETYELPGLSQKLQEALRGSEPFSLAIDTKNFASGKITGYPSKSFYFGITEQDGAIPLKEIRDRIVRIVPRFQEQEFHPHLTVATAIPNIAEEVIADSAIVLQSQKRIEIPVTSIRLTEVARNPQGQLLYKTQSEFTLS